MTVHNCDIACKCELVGHKQEAEGVENNHIHLLVRSSALIQTVLCVNKVVVQVEIDSLQTGAVRKREPAKPLTMQAEWRN